MATTDELYSEVTPDIEAVAGPLFEFSKLCLRKRGNFLPNGAVLDAERNVGFVAASADINGYSTSTEVLPLLHDGIRSQAKEKEVIAIGIAENVTITPNGQPSTEAIKVLFEHKQGLVVALYLPFKKQFISGYSFGEIFTVIAESEVNAWL
ncbi:hypothetical protein [Methylomonas methanica]|uniref:Uncharacterized protein n=1 Tax=Methylomonas methanica (strain DSM 25384 / MC09) TaxID=857087 RepID=G0A4W7_METMM|nr:hypothetical protein [Methylomonas methanica]AEF99130.1 hypothetical protein Metme_0688 [Methylomonas methanica MC09]